MKNTYKSIKESKEILSALLKNGTIYFNLVAFKNNTLCNKS